MNPVKNNTAALLFAITLFGLAGCNKHDPEDDPESEDRVVTVSFTAGPLSGSLLKSAANNAEKLINEVVIFGVDGSGDFVQKKQFTGSEGGTVTISRKIKKLYAIANPSTDITSLTSPDAATLMALTDSYLSAPASPFLMSSVVDVTSAYDVDFNFTRVIAKVEITGTNGFTISSVKVKNTPHAGYVFEQTAFSVPPGGSTVNYPTASYSPATASALFYVAENTNTDETNATQFEVTGQFSGQPLQTVTLFLKENGNLLAFSRNTYYRISIQ